jgi:hypothetical protein
MIPDGEVAAGNMSGQLHHFFATDCRAISNESNVSNHLVFKMARVQHSGFGLQGLHLEDFVLLLSRAIWYLVEC